MRLQCSKFKVLSSESEPLRVSADVELMDIGLTFRNCMITEDAVVQWLDLPASNRQITSAFLGEFTNERLYAAFKKAVFKTAKEAAAGKGPNGSAA